MHRKPPKEITPSPISGDQAVLDQPVEEVWKINKADPLQSMAFQSSLRGGLEVAAG